MICGVLFHRQHFLRDRAFTPLVTRLGTNVTRSARGQRIHKCRALSDWGIRSTDGSPASGNNFIFHSASHPSRLEGYSIE